MRKTIGLGLTTLAFLLGLAVGAVDSRTAHMVVAPAHALSVGGPGQGRGGCDGHGAPEQCYLCDGASCTKVCVGVSQCDVSYPNGVTSCLSGKRGCVSGGTVIGPPGGIVAY